MTKGIFASLGFIAIVGCASLAPAATFIVDTTDDNDDGVCGVAPDDCTLREAIDAANGAAGTDQIEFDPVVFPVGDPGVIVLAAALPVLSDPDGVTVDGRGAGVVVDGGALGSDDGLVIESGAGVPLSNVEVYDISLIEFPGRGLFVCAGPFDDCDEDLSKVRIGGVVATGNEGTGIFVRGSNVDDVRVMDSVASGNGGTGINVTSRDGNPLTKARVERCTAIGNDGEGVVLNAAGNNVGAKITDCTAARNGSDGMRINAGDDTVNPKVSDVTLSDNESDGFEINAGDDVLGAKIKDVLATGNGQQGIRVNAGANNTGTKISNVWVTGNGFGASRDGMQLTGFGVFGAKVTKSTSAGNAQAGLSIDGGAGGTLNAKVSNLVLVDNDENGLTLDGSNHTASKIVADGNGLYGVNLAADVPGGNNKLTKVRANGNGVHGIRVAVDSTNNKINKNEARGNAVDDLRDENAGCAGNQWTKNEFRQANDPCIE